MNEHSVLIWSWLNILTKKRYDALQKCFGSFDEATKNITMELLRQIGCREETAMKALNRLEDLDIEQYARELRKRGISVLSFEDETYPEVLRSMGDPPMFLYYKGSLEILDQPLIGCVGSREMSSYGKRVVEEFIPALAQAGLVTVSGLAYGIDTHVAKETHTAQGRTVAVLGHGLADVYPRENRNMAREIVERGGLLLSEFPLDVQPGKYTFPARNRIIAGISLGTVVFQAAEGSGALITADLALEYGRDVFAVPGDIFDPTSVGCHQYIAQGKAGLVSTPAEILTELGIVYEKRDRVQSFVTEDAEEEKIYRTLTTLPQSVSELVEKVGIDAATINAKLTILELKGVAKNVGGGMWVCI